MKIGLLLGMVLVTIAMLWLATGHGLILKTTSPESRSTTQQEGSISSSNLSRNNSDQAGDASTIDNPTKQPDLTIYEQAEKIQTKKFHIIRDGETLSDISRTYYGTANEWQKIFNANRETIKNVNKLKPGTKIVIPD
ncbi:MAG: LysM peptidoglycan-binding domain-containing protein [Phycisphaerales bacterium]